MANEGAAKLEAVIKSLRAEEKQVLVEREKIRNVFLERNKVFEVVGHELQKLEEKKISLESKNRSKAAVSSKSLNLSSVSAYLKRLEIEVTEVRADYEEKKREKNQASVRLDDANEEIVRLQLEIKRVQSILTSRSTEERYRRQATEDIQVEESNQFRNKRK